MKVYTFNGIDMIHITDFAEALQRSVPSTRRLIENGNIIRKLKFFRDRSRLMIPVTEIFGYPFVNAGRGNGTGTQVYHYRKLANGTYEKYLCEDCSFTNTPCAARLAADALVVPEGDK